ncbi:hypothetical protein BDV38DRAFT_288625 [Aspergillus pseudotamarii]|uniref:Zn(2)-C6 fungal-type domain-containing protein n=1 Tax=Aspergillus pseudotamarii TaxID=132259 RepID=A0A5N6S9X5_ASPPS|nr:uncharacterized protein BDV38DRAFT_288625 [Aspergillus pseudotamarii]KAE8131516.1 hypothetical protein BDV38DRAFT_288625 [Aspergillus pseudotamarii]
MKRQLVPKGPLSLTGTDSSQQRGVQKRAGPSCDACRTRRTKCDGLKPACSSCQNLQIQCAYSGYDRRTKEQWNARIVALEQRNQYLERLVQNLSCNNSPEAIHRTLELEQIPSQQQTRPTLQTHESLAEVRDITQVFYNATATHPTLDNTKIASAFDAGARLAVLPQEQFAWTALNAFFRCAGTLFYIITRQDAESLLERVYLSALNIARRVPKADITRASTGEYSLIEYRRVLQTVIFLEGWLSYSLGYLSDVHADEVELIHTLQSPGQLGLDHEIRTDYKIQTQMAKISLVASNIYKQICVPEQCSWEYANTIATHLDNLYQDLPPELHVSILRHSNGMLTFIQEKSLYLMHAFFLDTYLLLYCHYIKAHWHARSLNNGTCIADFFNDMPKPAYVKYTQYAIQLSRLISLLHGQEALMTRCWLAIQATFDASIMLLISACQNYYSPTGMEGVAESIAYVDSCFTVLQFCGSADVAAHRLLTSLQPLYDNVRRMVLGTGEPQGYEHNIDRVTTRSVIQSETASLGDTIRRLLNLLVSTHQVWV